MAKTDIEYGEYMWNVLTGCTIKSEGCVHCWAQKMAKRLKAMGRPEYQDAVDENGKWTGKITLVPERLNEPLKMRKPRHILVEFMGDLFHHDVPIPYIWDVFAVMEKTPPAHVSDADEAPGVYELISGAWGAAAQCVFRLHGGKSKTGRRAVGVYGGSGSGGLADLGEL